MKRYQFILIIIAALVTLAIGASLGDNWQFKDADIETSYWNDAQ